MTYIDFLHRDSDAVVMRTQKKAPKTNVFSALSGERDRIRTCDPVIKSHLLYQLSYAPDLLREVGKRPDARPLGRVIVTSHLAVYS